jgi:hypothetical protein
MSVIDYEFAQLNPGVLPEFSPDAETVTARAERLDIDGTLLGPPQTPEEAAARILYDKFEADEAARASLQATLAQVALRLRNPGQPYCATCDVHGPSWIK